MVDIVQKVVIGAVLEGDCVPTETSTLALPEVIAKKENNTIVQQVDTAVKAGYIVVDMPTSVSMEIAIPVLREAIVQEVKNVPAQKVTTVPREEDANVPNSLASTFVIEINKRKIVLPTGPVDVENGISG